MAAAVRFAPSRLWALVRRLLLEGDEERLLEAAVDEAIELVGAERAFLLRRRGAKRRGGKGRAAPVVAVARNLARESLGKGKAELSRSVAERVLESGEQIVTTSAPTDPALQGSRSVLFLGLRSILCVPIRGPRGVAGALYLDHRFETARFGPSECELVQVLADIIGVALENARLRKRAEDKAEALEQANAALYRDNERRAAEVERLGRLLETSGVDPGRENVEGGMVGRSANLRHAIEVARRVAPSGLPVLIEGPSGTGKELLARYLHEQSDRQGGPFLAVNCGAVPPNLLESELFGHVRGAFTGATRDHPGLFRAANYGTLLLDEIGEMSPQMQPRLLRALQEGEVWPVGRSVPTAVDVRILAATNRNLELEVEAGRFRQDLFYRLVGVRIELPPLAQRAEDIVLLAETFLERIAREPGMHRASLSRAAQRALLGHSWPGNVRELEQTLRRAVLLAESDVIQPHELGIGPLSPKVDRDRLRPFNRELVERTLRGTGGNRKEAARRLGVSRSTLYRWIDRYRLDT